MLNTRTIRILLGDLGVHGARYTPSHCLPDLKRCLGQQFHRVTQLNHWGGMTHHFTATKQEELPSQTLRQQWDQGLQENHWEDTWTDEQYAHDVYLQTHAILNPRLFTQRPYAIYLGMTHLMMRQEEMASGDYDPQEIREWYLHEKLIFDHAKWLFARSAAAALSLSDSYQQPLSKIHVIGAGATEILSPKTEKADHQTLLFIARRFQPDQLIRAMTCFRMIHARNNSLRLKIISPDPDFLVQGEGVEYMGPLQDHAQMLNAMSEAALLLNCQEDDPMATITLEAMNHGVVPVVSVGSTAAELVEDGLSGLMVDGKDPLEMARAANFILKDPKRINRMSRTGQDYISKIYSWNAVVKRMKRVIQG